MHSPRSARSAHLATLLVPALAAVVLSVTGGCDSGGVAPAGPRPDAGPPDLGDVPTWYEDVAPIAYRSCVPCHQTGGIAPFSMLSEASVVSYGNTMASKTAAREMPPMPVDNSGECHTFSNARWLSDAEIAVFDAWVEGGKVLGDPASAPTPPTPSTGVPGVTHTLDTGVSYMPVAPTPTATDDYRCFIVETGLTEDQYLTAYEVMPGDRRVVHHVIVYALPTAAVEQEAIDKDELDLTPGYECFGGPGLSATSPLALWAPGGGVTEHPPGTGVLINGGRKVVIQIHYNLIGGSFPDRTRVQLRMTPTAERAQLVPVLNHDMIVDGVPGLPPRRDYVETTAELNMRMRRDGSRVYGVAPHMHTLGRTMHIERTGAAGECLVDVDRWSFHWQQMWWYDEPRTLGTEQMVSITCGYDTTTRDAPTTWGESTTDEMCIAYFYVAP